ncbi:hypothetical protein VTJ04DRAFT_7814 [Mycothermus thermophilus]|uniref:uncharacterized protein n=1 Tax=Humicola insolens TaxID=85995 RepID=UPI00374479F1
MPPALPTTKTRSTPGKCYLLTKLSTYLTWTSLRRKCIKNPFSLITSLSALLCPTPLSSRRNHYPDSLSYVRSQYYYLHPH